MSTITYRVQDIISLDFGLNIEGTSHQPSEVKVVLQYKKKTYGAIADLSDGQYKAEFDLGTIPNLANDDVLELFIEITLNGRVFRPYKRKLEIIDYTEASTQTSEISNQALDIDIENGKEIKEEIEIIDEEKIISKSNTTPSWAKDILNGKDIPKDIDDQITKVVKSVMGSDQITPAVLKTEKITVKFNKTKKAPKPKPLDKLKIEVKEDFEFNSKIQKKSIIKRKKIELFSISEGKITYL